MTRTLILGLCALALACGDAAAPPLNPGTRAPGRLKVQDGRLVDEWGREHRLRGVNARIEGIFDVTFADGRERLQPLPEFTAEDAREMARAGFNYLRLPVNWSGIEPAEGRFDESYLQRIDRVLDWCRDAGLYTLIDVHQDAYSKEIGEDGAPLWAIVPPPEKLLSGPLTDLTERRTSRQVLSAFRGFFRNQDNVRDRFLPAWRLIAARWRDRSDVCGYQIMNEPVSIHVDPTQGLLYDFYRAGTAAFRAVNPDHPLWFEPDVWRNRFLSSPVPDVSPVDDDNIVYTPHMYPFVAGVSADSYDGWRAALQASFTAMRTEARAWNNAALVVGEWGERPDSDAAEPYIRAVRDMVTELDGGETIWLWKEISQGFWGFYDQDPTTKAWIRRELAFERIGTPWVLAAPGRIVSQRWDAAAKTLTTTWEARGGERAGALVYLPVTVARDTLVVTLDGRPVTAAPDELGRIALPPDGRAGRHTLLVRPK